MLEPVLHTLPDSTGKKKTVIGVDLVLKRGRVLGCDIMIPLALPHQLFRLEGVDARDVQASLGRLSIIVLFCTFCDWLMLVEKLTGAPDHVFE